MPGSSDDTRGFIHDLNNYLVAILNNAEFLVEDLTPGSPEHDFACRIHEGAEKAIALATAQRRSLGEGHNKEGRAASRDGRVHVLLVDDDELVLETMAQLMTRMGHEVTPVESGAAALAVLGAHKDGFDLVISDHHMAGITGFALAEHIKTDFPGLPVVLLSGHDRNDLGMVVKDNDAVSALLQKPVNRDSLAAVIAEVLGV